MRVRKEDKGTRNGPNSKPRLQFVFDVDDDHDAAEANDGDGTNSKTGGQPYPMKRTITKSKAARASTTVASAE